MSEPLPSPGFICQRSFVSFSLPLDLLLSRTWLSARPRRRIAAPYLPLRHQPPPPFPPNLFLFLLYLFYLWTSLSSLSFLPRCFCPDLSIFILVFLHYRRALTTRPLLLLLYSTAECSYALLRSLPPFDCPPPPPRPSSDPRASQQEQTASSRVVTGPRSHSAPMLLDLPSLRDLFPPTELSRGHRRERWDERGREFTRPEVRHRRADGQARSTERLGFVLQQLNTECYPK